MNKLLKRLLLILTKTIVFGLSYSVAWVWRFGVALESWSASLTLDRIALVHTYCTCSAYPCIWHFSFLSLTMALWLYWGFGWWSTWNSIYRLCSGHTCMLPLPRHNYNQRCMKVACWYTSHLVPNSHLLFFVSDAFLPSLVMWLLLYVTLPFWPTK